MRRCLRGVVLAACVAALGGSTLAQQAGTGQQTPAQQGGAAPQAAAADVKSVDGIIRTVYDVISGPAKQARDWNRFRSLFLPGARMIPSAAKPSANANRHMLSIEEYIERSDPLMLKGGFFESELSRRTEQFGNIAHVWSTYESRNAPGEKPFARGINSIQLIHDGERWWIIDIMWQGELPDRPLPKKYLKTP